MRFYEKYGAVLPALVIGIWVGSQLEVGGNWTVRAGLPAIAGLLLVMTLIMIHGAYIFALILTVNEMGYTVSESGWRSWTVEQQGYVVTSGSLTECIDSIRHRESFKQYQASSRESSA